MARVVSYSGSFPVSEAKMSKFLAQTEATIATWVWYQPAERSARRMAAETRRHHRRLEKLRGTLVFRTSPQFRSRAPATKEAAP